MDGQEVPEDLRRQGTSIRVPVVKPQRLATTVFPTLVEDQEPLEVEDYHLSPPWRIGAAIVRHIYVLDSLPYYAAMQLFFDRAMADRARAAAWRAAQR